jgi:hypothetical protein
MKTSKLAKVGAVLLTLAMVSAQAIASSNDQNGDQYAYVMVTGSLVPQKVKIHRIGTKTASNLRVYDRQEIDQTGRFTTEDVLALDPSLRATRGSLSSGH